jgi:pimeloyl-ACP methyl ester carboxylesterase
MTLTLLCLILSAAFAGAAFYVGWAEQPARLALDDAASLRIWKRSYARAYPMQAGLAAIAGVLGLAAAAIDHSIAAGLGGALMLLNWPYTILRLRPTNNRLFATPEDRSGPESRALIVGWGRRHAVRTALGMLATLAFLAALLRPGDALADPAGDLPRAIYADPAPDAAHPAGLAVLHIPSHGVAINAIAYTASGAGAHPTAVIFHGLPGNEKNLDLAQAIRRAGWNAVVFHYRGSWGSPGTFRFAQTLEDADQVLAYLEDPANARRLQVDTRRLVLIGHSMGGWVAIATAAHHPELLGLATYSAADLSRMAHAPAAFRTQFMAGNMEALAGVTAASLAQDVASAGHPFADSAQAIAAMPYLGLTANDGLAGDTDAFVAALGARGAARVETAHADTDHAWSDHRIALEAAVLRWLAGLQAGGAVGR